MAQQTPLSTGQAGALAGAAAVAGVFDFMSQTYLRRGQFAIQRSQARINEKFAERNFRLQTEALLKQKAAERKQLTDAARDAAAKKAANEAALRVARAEVGGTNQLAGEFIQNEAAHSAFYLGLKNALDQQDTNYAIQRGSLMNQRFAASMQAELAEVKPFDMGWFGAAMAGLNQGLSTAVGLASVTNFGGGGTQGGNT